MPIPIRINNDPRASMESNAIMDFSVLMNSSPESGKVRKVAATDHDAKLLFEIWSNCEKKNQDTFKIASSSINSRDLMRLKTLGFIHGDLNTVTFTSKGKTVVCTMALSEPNRFEQSRKEKNYSEILASMDKRNKPGYRVPKYASSNENQLDMSSERVEKKEQIDINPTFASHTMLNTFIKKVNDV